MLPEELILAEMERVCDVQAVLKMLVDVVTLVMDVFHPVADGREHAELWLFLPDDCFSTRSCVTPGSVLRLGTSSVSDASGEKTVP